MATSKPSRAFSSFICKSCRQRLLPPTRRQFGSTSKHEAKDDDAIAPLSRLSNQMYRTSNRQRSFNNPPASGKSNSPLMSVLNTDRETLLAENFRENLDGSTKPRPLHRMHVYAHKHNTHITLVQPPKSAAETTSSRALGARVTAAEQKKTVDVLMSLSTGNIGFRKAGRGSYDAAFQLAAFTLKQIQEKGIMMQIYGLQVILRGFGAGREAVTKALLGTEGRVIRPKIKSVVDATRLKQGGPRSKKPRRLG